MGILQGAPRPSALLGRPMADRELSIPAQEVLHPQVWRRWGVSTGPQGQGGRSQGDLVTDVFPIRVERRGKQCSCIGVVGPDCLSAFGL